MADRRPVAVVLMAYGTPRSPDEIEPYYIDIRRGRPPSAEQLADLVARYDAIGGISPLAARTEAQRDALQRALDEQVAGRYSVALGLKHAAPMIEQTVTEAIDAGAERVIGVVLAPHYSAFSVGQYLARVEALTGPAGVTTRGLRSWSTEPAFVTFLADDVRRRLAAMPPRTHVLFTAHSLPRRIVDSGDPYPDELRATAAAVATEAGLDESRWSTAWQSAGRTPEPWLGPDVLEAIDSLAVSGGDDARTIDGVVVCACGFVADHLEVLYDLDIEAATRARRRGLAFDRTTCVNDDASVMTALATRVIELDD